MSRLGRSQLWIWLGIVVIAFIVVGMFGESRQPKQYPPYVSHSPSPTGTKALFTYLKESDYSVKQWNHEPSLLTNEEGGQLLLMIEPAFIPTAEEFTDYKQFMERGNTILLFSEYPADYFNTKVSFSDEFHGEDDELTYNGQTFKADIDPVVQLVIEEKDEKLLYDSLGAHALKRSFGEGSLVVVSASSMLMNSQILEEDHAELVTLLIDDFTYGNQAVLFDEFVHEGGLTAAFIGAYPVWFLVFIFQIAIIAILWLVYKGKRFGPVFAPRDEYVRFGDEGIVALASWYMRGKRYQDSLNIQADYVKQLLNDRWGIPYKQSWQESQSTLKKRWKFPTKNIGEFVIELEEVLMNESINKARYVQWSKLLDELRKEVEEG